MKDFPFVRRMVVGFYLAGSIIFCIAILVSIWRSAREMVPPHPVGAKAVLTPEACGRGAEALALELSQTISSNAPFEEFRRDWIPRERKLEALCGYEGDASPQMERVFIRLNKLFNAYADVATWTGRNIAPQQKAFREAVEALSVPVR